MTRVFLIIVSILINPISIFADTTEDFDLTADHDCFLEVVTKVYVNPERIFCEDEKYYLYVDQKTEVPLQNLQSDLKGYFVEFNPSMKNSKLAELIYHHGVARQSCPLCGRDGYYAGICANKDCPGKENRRKHEEEHKRKKEEYKKKREEGKKKK